ncbi:hypothetical protein WA1_26455 [Scytonema hofmannii PCC 7110]|uniref:Uncharacterized protein n=1 Tax=Scytonema hofmannii PCC 7110 TaxID=128403 RepID=A0A139X6Z1_9CYAN|nr:hypothetical protein [Scytonema hofmannii]KYC40469.1 hypothetical protein WA1_26455 [Scytonema hofmannii PCC 7110]
MTNANNGNNNNSQEIYAILAELARRQLQTENNLQRTQEQIERTQLQIDATQQQLSATQYEVESLTNDVTRILGRSAILDDVLLEMRNSNQAMQANFERHIENYEEHKRTTNAALNSLEAINIRLIQIITGDQN